MSSLTLTVFPRGIASLLIVGTKVFIGSMRSNLVGVTVHTAFLKVVPAQLRFDYRFLLEYVILHSTCEQEPILETCFLPR